MVCVERAGHHTIYTPQPVESLFDSEGLLEEEP